MTMLTGTEAAPTAAALPENATTIERCAAVIYPATPRNVPPADKAPADIVEMRNASGAGAYLKSALNEYGPTKKGEHVGKLALGTRDSEGRVVGGNAIDQLVMAVNPAAPNAQLVDQAAQLGPMATDVGFTKKDIETLTGFASQAQVKPPTAEEQRAHQFTALKELRTQYGEQFDDALRDAKALVSRDPRLAQFLNTAKLSNHPWVVLRLAELGRTERARGRLK